MKFVTAAAAIAMTLASCGNTAKQNSSSSVKSEAAAKADYSCTIWSTLDANGATPEGHSQETFEFKSTDTSITKIVGVTPGDRYIGAIARDTIKNAPDNSGAIITISIYNTVKKVGASAAIKEGDKDIMMSMNPEDKFHVGILCAKKP